MGFVRLRSLALCLTIFGGLEFEEILGSSDQVSCWKSQSTKRFLPQRGHGGRREVFIKMKTLPSSKGDFHAVQIRRSAQAQLIFYFKIL